MTAAKGVFLTFQYFKNFCWQAVILKSGFARCMVLSCTQYLHIVVMLVFRRLWRLPINRSIAVKLGEKELKIFFAYPMGVDERLESL
jgi:hypothetical protein